MKNAVNYDMIINSGYVDYSDNDEDIQYVGEVYNDIYPTSNNLTDTNTSTDTTLRDYFNATLLISMIGPVIVLSYLLGEFLRSIISY